MNNREIKFRAWDKKRKAFFPMHPCFNSASQSVSITTDYLPKHENASHNDVRNPENFEFCQYTGLKDKNGKEIYEGDVVTWWDGAEPSAWNPRVAVVEFSPELAFRAMNVRSHDGKMGYKFSFGNFVYDDTEKHLEVIGNVFENPELVK